MCSSDSKKATTTQKPHAICIPFPVQSHISAMLKLAKLLHQHNFRITFVNTEYNHRRLLKSRGPSAASGLPDFRFATIPDGLPPTDAADATQDTTSLCGSTPTMCLEPFCELIERLNDINSATDDEPPVTCIVSDGAMSFTLKAADRFGLPEVLFWPVSPCGLLGFTQYRKLVEKGYVPLKDMSQVTDGYLNTVIDWIPGMKGIELRDLPSFIRTTDPKDTMLNFVIQETNAIPRARALVINTFDALDRDVLSALSSMFPRGVYAVGPLQLMLQNHVKDRRLDAIESSLWKADGRCIEWLDAREPGSVLYVNFGSIAVVTPRQMSEFAWGLANSKKPFLWVVRPDLVTGDGAVLPRGFVAETRDRSMMIDWCDQERVLKHGSIGGFLTHCGWNSTIESMVSGVPVICWPFFADQLTNCRYCCVEWGIGMEIDNDVKRGEVESIVNELMDGEKGKRMKEKAVEWKRRAEEAAEVGGSSYSNLSMLIEEVLLQ